jgi:DNA-binding transcriptional LysR family regulator
MSTFDWNDVRYFLAVARDGSTLIASRALKVSQPTVARRIAALEQALEVPLFERHQTGYRPTEQARALMAEFEAMGEAADRLQVSARLQSRRIAGVIRLTTNDVIANQVLAQALREFRQRYPDVRVEVTTTDRFLDLSGGEVDIAIRAGLRPTEPDLVSRLLDEHHWGVFGSPKYLALHGTPRLPAELSEHAFIELDGAFGTLCSQWLRHNAPEAETLMRSSSLLNVVSHARAGLGLAMLPIGFWRDDPELVCCLEIPELSAGIWLLTHERLRNVPRIRAFLDFTSAYQLFGRPRGGAAAAAPSRG